jgi:hypothetical protein
MSFLLWSCLNAVFSLLFFYAGWKVIVALRQKIGLLYTTIFALGMLTSASKPAASPPSTDLLHPKNPAAGAVQPLAPINTVSTTKRPLGPSCTLNLITYSGRRSGQHIPQTLHASVDGLVMGHSWEPMYGHVIPQDRGWKYLVTFKHEWKLLSYVVVTSFEDCEGVVATTP